MAQQFLSILAASDLPLLGDGAMGTLLNAQGVGFNQCFDDLNRSDPAMVAGIHRLYLEAGAQVIQTNTFGANRFKLAAFGLADQVAELNRLGVGIAREAVISSGMEALVAGDVGPLGVRLAPFGRVQAEQARQAFAEQIAALADAGADLLILETFSDLAELQQAIAAAHQASDLSLVASMTFTRDDRTLLGDSAAKVARLLAESGADVIGVNCSGGPAQVLRLLGQMRAALLSRGDRPPAYFSVMPNAGWPEQVGGRVMYPAHPEYFGEYALAFCVAGARLLGGCCGTTPQHIAAMRLALDSQPRGCAPLLEEYALPVDVEEEAAQPAYPSRLA